MQFRSMQFKPMFFKGQLRCNTYTRFYVYVCKVEYRHMPKDGVPAGSPEQSGPHPGHLTVWLESLGSPLGSVDPNTLHPPTTILGHTRQSDCLRLLEVSLGNPPPLF